METEAQVEPTTMPQDIWDQIVAHSREGKPEEICGILRGRGPAAFELYRGDNVAEERIENYTVDAGTLLKQFDFEDAGDEMMGIYHSHPDSDAYPSATDAWNAHYPDSIYFICSLEYDDDPVIRAFRMTPHFLDLDLEALAAEVHFDQAREGLFGYYQHEDGADSPALAQVLAQAPTPCYIVYATDSGALDQAGGRVVSIVEHPVEISAAS